MYQHQIVLPDQCYFQINLHLNSHQITTLFETLKIELFYYSTGYFTRK